MSENTTVNQLEARTVARGSGALHIVLVYHEWISAPSFGGIARYIADLAYGLASIGHRVTVVTTADTDSSAVEQGVLVVRVRRPLGVSERPIKWLVPLVISARLAKAVRRIDIVEFSNYGADGYVASLRKVGAHVTRVSTMGWQSDRPRLHPAIGSVRWRWEDWLETVPIRRSDLVITPSKSHALLVKERLGLRQVPRAIPHGTRSAKVAFSGGGYDASNCFLCVGRIEPRKGTATLLAAFAEALARLPQRTRLVLAGGDTRTGPDGTSYRDFIMAKVSPAARERVDVLGWIDDETLESLYRTCRAVVIPSKYESFGLAAVEGMRHGKPVIASKVGGLQDVVNDGYDGLLVSPDDSRAWADALVRFSNDPELAATCGANALAHFHESFTIERFLVETERAYREVLSKDQ
jgi:glycosyltransferase involved in cell wall biosynthesis